MNLHLSYLRTIDSEDIGNVEGGIFRPYTKWAECEIPNRGSYGRSLAPIS